MEITTLQIGLIIIISKQILMPCFIQFLYKPGELSFCDITCNIKKLLDHSWTILENYSREKNYIQQNVKIDSIYIA